MKRPWDDSACGDLRLDDIPANYLRHYPAYKNGAFNLTELSRLCGISRTTAYKYIGLLEQ
jgi:response regulator of citrate/malate metabolism